MPDHLAGVCGGWLHSGRSRVSISLLIGFYRGRKLHFCASVLAGFVPASRRALYARLELLITPRSPFVNVPESSPGRWGQGCAAERMKSCVWVRPRMVVRCAFQEWAANDHLRRVSYVGVREDKDARQVVKET